MTVARRVRCGTSSARVYRVRLAKMAARALSPSVLRANGSRRALSRRALTRVEVRRRNAGTGGASGTLATFEVGGHLHKPPTASAAANLVIVPEATVEGRARPVLELPPARDHVLIVAPLAARRLGSVSWWMVSVRACL